MYAIKPFFLFVQEICRTKFYKIDKCAACQHFWMKIEEKKMSLHFKNVPLPQKTTRLLQ